MSLKEWTTTKSHLGQGISFMLVSVAIIPLLVGLSISIGESLTTMTSYTTITSTVSVTSFVETPVDLVSPYYKSGVLTIPATPAKFQCTAAYIPFTAQAGQELEMDYNSSLPFSFYLMTEKGYNVWHANENCLPSDSIKGEIIISKTASTSFSTAWAVNATGKYYLKFTNIETRKETRVQFAATVRQPSVQGQTMLVMVAETYTQTLPSVTIVSSTEIETSSSSAAPDQTPLIATIAIIVVGLTVAGLYIRFRRR